jgi:hypothetical protein
VNTDGTARSNMLSDFETKVGIGLAIRDFRISDNHPPML